MKQTLGNRLAPLDSRWISLESEAQLSCRSARIYAWNIHIGTNTIASFLPEHSLPTSHSQVYLLIPSVKKWRQTVAIVFFSSELLPLQRKKKVAIISRSISLPSWNGRLVHDVHRWSHCETIDVPSLVGYGTGAEHPRCISALWVRLLPVAQILRNSRIAVYLTSGRVCRFTCVASLTDRAIRYAKRDESLKCAILEWL